MVNQLARSATGALRRRSARLRYFVERHGTAASPERAVEDAGTYWTVGDDDPAWEGNSHWRAGLDDDVWTSIGSDHLAMFKTFANAVNLPPDPGVMAEWGCGGGANAVAFAPIADAFVAIDISRESLDECVRQVATVCDTATEAVLVDIKNLEAAALGREGTCNTFICLYVIELLPSDDDARRILRIAERMLVPGGLAMVQIKYHTADWRPQRYKRNYARSLSTMTTFGIDEFWLLAGVCGLTPRLVSLVPENQLDTRYAYYALTKP